MFWIDKGNILLCKKIKHFDFEEVEGDGNCVQYIIKCQKESWSKNSEPPREIVYTDLEANLYFDYWPEDLFMPT